MTTSEPFTPWFLFERLFLSTALWIIGACSSQPAVWHGERSQRRQQERISHPSFMSADGVTKLAGDISFPEGAGLFPAVVMMVPRMCEGPAGIPEPWQQTVLPSWGYATLVIDSFAARGLKVSACSDFTVLQPSQTIGDAYGALEFLRSQPNIDPNRIALAGFGGQGTTALLTDTTEARNRYLPKGEPGFRAVFAFYPYCNVEFSKGPPRAYAPERILAGERDDISPASRCVELGNQLRSRGVDVEVIVYPHAEAGFDIVPADANYEVQDPIALHPGNTTISTHPQFDPWGENLSACTFTVASVFDLAKRSDANVCLRRGVHFQGDATTAEEAKNDLRKALVTLMP